MEQLLILDKPSDIKELGGYLADKNHYKSSVARRRSQAAYRIRNLEKRRQATREYRKRNPEKVKESARKSYVKRRGTTEYKLIHSLRNRLRIALFNNEKSGSAIEDLGCSIKELKCYLESKFKNGMTWQNYGHKGWHIDHIIPLKKFQLKIRVELLKACHYTNLQPLWAKDNLTKGAS